MNDKSSKLGTQKISKLVIGFSATVLAGLLLSSVYTLTDALFISRCVGDNAMGGVSLILPFTIFQGAVSTTVGSGASALVSRKLGEEKPYEAGSITLNAMFIFYITAVITTALGFIFMNPMLKILGCTGELEKYAREYFTIILAGNIFSTGFSSIIRAEGRMVYGLLIWVIPISINISLDALFIMKLSMGVKGSAIATVICQFISFSMSVLFFTKFTSQKFKGAKLSLKTVSEIIGIGLPSLIQTGSLSIMSALFNNSLSKVSGETGINSFAYISKLITFGLSPITAFSTALVPVAGYSFGAKQYKRANQAADFCLRSSIIYGISAIALAFIFPEKLIRIFTDSEDIILLAANGLRIISFSLLFSSIPMTAGAFYQASGKKAGAFLMFSITVIFAVPLLYILPKYLSLNGVWLSYSLASFLAATVAAAMYFRLKNNNKTEYSKQSSKYGL